MKDERRAFERTRYFVEVELDGLLKARLLDLSPEGAFVESRSPFTPGAVIQLRFNLRGRDIQIAAEIRHCAPGIGMGVKFLDLDPLTRAALARVLAGEEQQAQESQRQPKPGEKVATMCRECQWHEAVSIAAVSGPPGALATLRCSACSASWSVPVKMLLPCDDSPAGPWRPVRPARRRTVARG